MEEDLKAKKEIVHKLLASRDFLERCILLLYEHQEDDEQEKRYTIYENSVGFNKPDSFQLSYISQHFLTKGKHLMGRELRDARKRMVKYAKQLKKLGALNFIDECKNSMEEIKEKTLKDFIETKKEPI